MKLDRMMDSRLSRRKLFQGMGGVAAGLALGSTVSLGNGNLGKGPLLRQVGLLRTVAQEDESVQDVINVAITAEALAVSLLGGAVSAARSGGYGENFPEYLIDILNASRAEEQFHYDYLEAAGAVPLTTTFTIPDPALLTSRTTLFETLVQLETAFVAAYMAGGKRFAELGQTELVKISMQTTLVEAEHRVLANYALGNRPANDFGFYPALFDTLGDAAQALQDLGFIGGDGAQVMYPGPGAIEAGDVMNKTPGGKSVVCTTTPPPPTPGPTLPTDPVTPIQSCAYFPETGHNVCGVFLEFWQQNGDLPVFGFPLTEAFEELNYDTGETYLVQYFERQRFEHHPENAGTVYEVLLGRLGAEILGRQGRDWRSFPKGSANQPHYFAETGHNITPEFWDYWRRYGLNYGDGGVSVRESLLLFGYPLSEAAVETNEDGDTVLTQWFERAVFEHHPTNGDHPVLLRRLGAELLDHLGA